MGVCGDWCVSVCVCVCVCVCAYACVRLRACVRAHTLTSVCVRLKLHISCIEYNVAECFTYVLSSCLTNEFAFP